jgi:hypothetical protein
VPPAGVISQRWDMRQGKGRPIMTIGRPFRCSRVALTGPAAAPYGQVTQALTTAAKGMSASSRGTICFMTENPFPSEI